MEDLRQYIDENGNCVLPEGVTDIFSWEFDHCESLKSIIIPQGITRIDEFTFYCCNNLESITLPNSVTSIETGAFNSCYSLKSITLPDSIENIGNNAFSACTNLESISIPKGVTAIKDYTFSGCINLKSITIPDSVTSIGEGAFYGCTSLKSIVIPEGVTTIKPRTFADCHNLESITIPESVTHLDKSVLCRLVGIIYFNNPDPSKIGVTEIKKEGEWELEQNIESNQPLIIDSTATVYVPEGSLEKYRNHPSFKYIENIKEFKKEVSNDILSACRMAGEKEVKNNNQTIISKSKLSETQTKSNSLKR